MLAFEGPPFVRLTDSSNSCSVPFVDIIAVRSMVGLSSGMVIFKKVWKADAPSILAASYTEYSIF